MLFEILSKLLKGGRRQDSSYWHIILNVSHNDTQSGKVLYLEYYTYIVFPCICICTVGLGRYLYLCKCTVRLSCMKTAAVNISVICKLRYYTCRYPVFTAWLSSQEDSFANVFFFFQFHFFLLIKIFFEPKYWLETLSFIFQYFHKLLNKQN